MFTSSISAAGAGLDRTIRVQSVIVVWYKFVEVGAWYLSAGLDAEVFAVAQDWFRVLLQYMAAQIGNSEAQARPNHNAQLTRGKTTSLRLNGCCASQRVRQHCPRRIFWLPAPSARHALLRCHHGVPSPLSAEPRFQHGWIRRDSAVCVCAAFFKAIELKPTALTPTTLDN